MNCQHAREVLEEMAADGGEEAVSALAHGSECTVCRTAMAEVARWQAVLHGSADEGSGTPDGGWEQFERRLKAGLRQHRTTDPRRRTSICRVLKAAAAVLIGCIGFQVGRGSASSAPGGEEVAHAIPTELMTQTDVASGAAAFREVASMFQGQAGWVLLANGQSELGLRPTAAPSASALTVVRLRVDGSRGTTTSADLVMIAGEMATLRIGLPDGREVVWQVLGESSQLSVWAELRDAGTRRSLGTLGGAMPLKHDLRGRAIGQIETAQEVFRVSAAMAEVEQAAAKPAGGATL